MKVDEKTVIEGYLYPCGGKKKLNGIMKTLS